MAEVSAMAAVVRSAAGSVLVGSVLATEEAARAAEVRVAARAAAKGATAVAAPAAGVTAVAAPAAGVAAVAARPVAAAAAREMGRARHR